MIASTASTALISDAASWVNTSMARFGNRSAITPPHAPNSSSGVNWIAIVRPTRAMLPVSSSTSQSVATRIAQPAMFEMPCDAAYLR